MLVRRRRSRPCLGRNIDLRFLDRVLSCPMLVHISPALDCNFLFSGLIVLSAAAALDPSAIYPYSLSIVQDCPYVVDLLVGFS